MANKLLLTILTILVLINISCGYKVQKPIIQEKIVYQKCEIPDIPKSELEQINENDDYVTKLQKLIHNYGKLKSENILLRDALNLCK